ncbi:MAG TPA: type VI secretion system tip protein TssI/VgrG, partial [Pyrinomonadaceae bacterium]|nr:type VI secretion system tip protein TssI/VgrG [Pyrinomonadaceae bacterium]
MADERATQKGRVLEISVGGHDDDFLLLRKIEAREEISGLFEIKAELLHEEENGLKPKVIKPEDILGKSVTIRLTVSGEENRYYSGIINHFSQGPRTGVFSHYYATIVPHFWLLTRQVQSRIFQDMKVPDILNEVLQGPGLTVLPEIYGDHKSRNYVVQYRESDFDFACRLMEEEGIYYFFVHEDGMDKLVIADTPKSHRDTPTKKEFTYYETEIGDELDDNFITRWTTEYQLDSGKITLWDNHFQKPQEKFNAERQSSNNAGGNRELEIYDCPGDYAKRFDGIDKANHERANDVVNIYDERNKDAQTRMQAIDALFEVATGNSLCAPFTSGHKFTLKGHPTKELNKQYMLLSVEFVANQSPEIMSNEEVEFPYSNTFSCMPFSTPFRPLNTANKPVVHGMQTATVVGKPGDEEIYTDKYGRVKVQFHWDRTGQYDPSSSAWLRVAKDIAGKQWGSMFIPRVGQEVLVAFLHGDPDQPIIVGCVYNAEQMPHYELPKFKTLTYIKTRTSPDNGKGFNELRFEDKADKEQVFVHSQRRYDLRVRGSMYETCGGNRQEVVGYKVDDKNKTESGGNLAISVGGNYDLHVKGDRFITIDGKLNEGIKGDVVEGYDSNQQTVVKSKVEINAQTITIEGSQAVNLKVGSSCIIVDMMGITIQGPMVKINSGGSASPTSPASLDDALDAEAADTGDPGYLDKPRSGGGGGRKHHTLNGQHAPSVTRNADGTYSVGGDKLKVKGTDDFIGKTMKDLSILYNTPTGKKVIDKINSGKHETTIETLDEDTAKKNGGLCTPSNPADSKTPGKGSDSKVQYNPDVPDGGYKDQNGKDVTLPNAAMLGHELIHAVHNDQGNNLQDNKEPTEPDSNQEESQTIGIHGHEDDDLTHNKIL